MKLREILKKIKTSNTRNDMQIKEINYDRLKEEIKKNSNIVIIDVRSPQEFAENRITFAINIPLYELKNKIFKIIPDKNKLIILYCQYGARSKKAYKILEQQGYTNIYSLQGGIESTM